MAGAELDAEPSMDARQRGPFEGQSTALLCPIRLVMMAPHPPLARRIWRDRAAASTADVPTLCPPRYVMECVFAVIACSWTTSEERIDRLKKRQNPFGSDAPGWRA